MEMVTYLAVNVLNCLFINFIRTLQSKIVCAFLVHCSNMLEDISMSGNVFFGTGFTVFV